MVRFRLALLVLLLSGNASAGSYVELGTGFNTNPWGCTVCWDDAGAGPLGAYLRVGHEWKYIGVHWMHISQWNKGWPVNTDRESSVDHIGVYLRFEF
jgi:hypothetical protein